MELKISNEKVDFVKKYIKKLKEVSDLEINNIQNNNYENNIFETILEVTDECQVLEGTCSCFPNCCLTKKHKAHNIETLISKVHYF